MKTRTTVLGALLASALLGGAALVARAQSVEGISARELAQEVTQGCANELQSYCQDVTPGNGRLLACLYAREDKLSAQCEYALYDSSAQLQRMVSALTYVAAECQSDLDKYCKSASGAQVGLVQCLEDHESELSSRCTQAREDTDLADE
jgi:hypothetical protein